MADVRQIRLPTKVFDSVHIFEEDEEIMNELPESDGKWLLFFTANTIDEMWTKACKAYRNKELTGISSLKSSTMMKTERMSPGDSGKIVFHCGPASDQHLMFSYGRKLASILDYYDDTMVYKTDHQSQLGTRSLGQTINSIYKLKVERPVRDGRFQSTSYVELNSVPSTWIQGYGIHQPNRENFSTTRNSTNTQRGTRNGGGSRRNGGQRFVSSRNEEDSSRTNENRDLRVQRVSNTGRYGERSNQRRGRARGSYYDDVDDILYNNLDSLRIQDDY